MNKEYKKLQESGFSILPKSGKHGLDRLYLLKNHMLIDFIEFDNNRRTSTVEDFENTRENSHKDMAMCRLNLNIATGKYNN